MRAFRDTSGREWVIELTVGSCRRLAALAGVDLHAASPADLTALISDPARLASCLFAIRMGGRDTREADLAGGLTGDAMGEAADAFARELFGYFPPATGPEDDVADDEPAWKRERRLRWEAKYGAKMDAAPPTWPEMIARWAGELRLDPSPFTLRDLAAMAEAASRDRWVHTSHAMAATLNAMRAPGSEPVRADQLNPHLAREKKRKPPKASIDVLQSLLPRAERDRLAREAKEKAGAAIGGAA